MSGPLGAIVLAGGAASRFGSNKLLAPLHGYPLLLHPLRALRGAGIEKITLVTGAYHQAISEDPSIREWQTHHRIAIVHCADWQLGMGASLAAGIRQQGPADTLVILGDQPAVTEADIQTLVSAWRARPTQPAAAYFQDTLCKDTLGPPAIFPAAWHKALLTMPPSRGAKALLMSATDVTRVAMASAARDIDTLADLKDDLTEGD